VVFVGSIDPRNVVHNERHECQEKSVASDEAKNSNDSNV